MLNVNLGALIHLTRLILPEMIKRGKGKIVNNASVSGVMFMPCASTYAASKAGVVAFTRSLEQELKDTGVSTLLLFTPGVKTDMYDQIYDDYSGHLDLSFLTSISSEAWSKIVFKAIENDHSECLPTSLRNRVGLWLAQHFRPAFNKVIANGFKR
jgi:short-subunit dehydrogenase